jgi:L-threonylcarbamoyladenylate synthase
VNLLRSRAAAARMLAEGGLVRMPTDTLPGLHCRADRPDAVGRLRRMKGRPEGKLFLLLCSSLRQVRTLAELSSRRVLAYCQTCWPGPFTLILPAAAAGPVGLASSSRAVALRIPDAAALRRLIAEARGALVSTSATGLSTAGCDRLAASPSAAGPGAAAVVVA